MQANSTGKSLFPVLLIDDDQTLGDILSRAAQKTFPEASFISVLTTQDAIQYLDEPTENAPRLILLDIDFGRDEDGLSFLPVLRNHPRASLVPTIMLSALVNEENVRQAYETGAVSFLQKPMTYQGWQEQIAMLRAYWYEVVHLPSNPSGNGTASHYRVLN